MTSRYGFAAPERYCQRGRTGINFDSISDQSTYPVNEPAAIMRRVQLSSKRVAHYPMPAPSVRSKIAGVGSFRDFASKHKQQIAVLTAKIAVPTATLALVTGVSVAKWQSGEHITKTAVEDLGEFWACMKAPDLLHIGDFKAAAHGNIPAAKDVGDAAKDVWDQFGSCTKAVKWVGKNLGAEYRPLEKEGGKVVERVEKEGGMVLKEGGKVLKEGGKVLKEGGKVIEQGGEHGGAE